MNTSVNVPCRFDIVTLKHRERYLVLALKTVIERYTSLV